MIVTDQILHKYNASPGSHQRFVLLYANVVNLRIRMRCFAPNTSDLQSTDVEL
jgi:hypothetical protein